MEEMEMRRKKIKKLKRSDGSFVYEELKSADPKLVGIEYLEMVKEMASKQKGKRKSSVDLGQQ